MEKKVRGEERKKKAENDKDIKKKKKTTQKNERRACFLSLSVRSALGAGLAGSGKWIQDGAAASKGQTAGEVAAL